MKVVSQLGNDVGRKAACEALQIPRATFYRHIERPDKPASDTVGEPTVPPGVVPYSAMCRLAYMA